MISLLLDDLLDITRITHNKFELRREPLTVQYEGEYDEHAAVTAPPKKTQYDKIKGINPEDL